MKKFCVLLLAALLIAASVIPAAAADWADKEFTSTLDDFPTWLSKAETVEFEEHFESGKTNARNGQSDIGQGYVYLKEDGKGDFTVPFTVKEDGVYDIAVLLMAWTKGVPRSSQFKIDDSEWIYICFDYTEDDQYAEQYIYDISIELAKGEHTFTIGLADDFNDSTVKSLYFDSFSYVLKEAKAEETTAPAEETTAPAEETTAPAEETTAPAEETTAPAEETTAPAEETTAPAEETTAPAEETTAPAEETTAPAEETTAPAEETTAPAESETAQAPTEDTAAPQTFDFALIAVAAAVVSLAGFAISKKK